jgi:deoxyribose-phosphate aldolase
MGISKSELARIIDSTNVKQTATKNDIEGLRREAVQHDLGCVCVNPVYVRVAAAILKGSSVRVSLTVGFPFGSSLAETKEFEAVRAVKDGARELDMVINLSLLKSGDYPAVKQDIEAVVNVKRTFKFVTVKVIIEAPCLTRSEKIVACKLSKEAGADFVKTSTGFFGGGATVADVRLMRQVVGRSVGVKAAWGIRTYADAVRMVEAGANRIGTSAAVEVLKGAPYVSTFSPVPEPQ